MSDFTLPREQRWFEEVGRYDNIEIVDTDADTIHCRVTDEETVLVADVSDSFVDYRDRSHAWLPQRSDGRFQYGTACRHMGGVPSSILAENRSRHTLIERVPCDACKNALQ